MKKFSYAMLLGCVAGAMVLSACNPLKDIPNLVAVKTADFSKAEEIEDFYANHNPDGNGTPFNVGWNKDNVSMENAEMHLKLTKVQEDEDIEYPYWGGEYRSKKFYGYGDYSVEMKPAKLTGTASTFFIYTGEWDSENLHPSTGPNDTRNPDNLEGKHDEIDIEFLGQDTTKVQFNYFTNGKGGNEKMYDLGFDASKEYHTYGFRWEKNRITWFVDLKPVYTVTKNIPTHPGRIIANYWAGDEEAEDWMGKVDDSKLGPEATYKWLGITVKGKETHKEEPEPGEGPITLEFNNAPYQCTNADGVSTIKYDRVENDTWKNVWANIASSYLAEGKNTLSFKVENKGEESVRFVVEVGANDVSRLIDIKDADWFNPGDNRAQYNVAAGETRVFKLVFHTEPQVDHIMMFINSTDGPGSVHENGHIVISEVAFSVTEVEEPEENVITLGFGSEVYQCTNANGVSTIKYESIGANEYTNVWANLASETLGDNNVLSFKVENKGSENARLYIEVGVTGDSSCLINNNDGDWFSEGDRRVQYNVAPGATRVITLQFDASANVDHIMIFYDSCYDQAGQRENGWIEISEVTFSKIELAA